MNFNQQLHVEDFNDIPRAEFYKSMLAGNPNSKVLHIGCADFPFIEEHNLHLALYHHCELYGVDTNEKGLDILRERGIERLYSSIAEVPKQEFDVVIVPEVIEHVANVAEFLYNLRQITSRYWVFTAPCAVQCGRRGHFAYTPDKNNYEEIVHPEHLVWYTPYTLYNTINSLTPLDIQQVFWNNNISCGVIARSV